jgi:hypothetical protein
MMTARKAAASAAGLAGRSAAGRCARRRKRSDSDTGSRRSEKHDTVTIHSKLDSVFSLKLGCRMKSRNICAHARTAAARRRAERACMWRVSGGCVRADGSS